MTLKSFGENLTAVVFGANGGIGAAFVEALLADAAVTCVHAVSRTGQSPGNITHACDYSDEAHIKAVAEAIKAQGPVNLVIVATGILHSDGISPEKTWRHIDADAMARVFAANTITPTIIAKHMLPLLDKNKKTVFTALSARVGSIGDNRLGGWTSYRASKAALNMVIRTLSIELARINRDAYIIGMHPGTVATALSDPFTGDASRHTILTATDSVDMMLNTLDTNRNLVSGTVISYSGETLLN